MNTQEKISLIKTFAEEILTDQELETLFNSNKRLTAYDGFEPSGNPHIAQGIVRAININKLTKTGIKFKILIADWHAWANNKLNGNLDDIQICGKYLIEIWKATGIDSKNIEFIWANDLVNDKEYWKKVMQIARNSTVQRIIRCSQIMGRKDKEILQSSQILYPCMQCADIFYLKVDIAQLGLDQRKVNVLAREVGPKLFNHKPVAIHHHMLLGLGQPPKTIGQERAIELKMSKSKPDSAIFMTDSEQEIKQKIKNAYCPIAITEENPILEYCKYIIFEKFKDFKIERDKKFGGDIIFKSYSDLEKAFKNKEIHPLDLKNSVSVYINEILEPIRKHFEKNSKAKELYNSIKKFKITR